MAERRGAQDRSVHLEQAFDRLLAALVHGSFVKDVRIGERELQPVPISAMPFKHNICRRHHIGKMKFKVTNWLSVSWRELTKLAV